ncbi:MAG: cation diffusion facilitator family transporter [Erysipelotrichaceae bacterium]|nr:cation diffusion facilitator family transporter [Erysipelotrichaceae bacterium]
MFNLFCKNFIPSYEKVDNPVVRERYGVVFSIFSIVCNIIAVVTKLVISFITNSVSIRADAFNNLSDIGSNLATLFGFALSNKHSDSSHPYGFGRMEYISGMVVAFLILLMGFESLIESIQKIIHPEEFVFSYAAIVVLLISIGIKLLMYVMNGKAGKAINSDALLAASKDSISDVLVTSSSLLCVLLLKFFNINIDSYVGIIVALLVIKSGLEVFFDVLNTILGSAPDKELVKQIEQEIMSHDEIMGIHDLIIHDYGPSHRFMTLHCEVDAYVPVIETHDKIDNIEMDILNKYGILTTIHMDPIDTKDELAKELKPKIADLVENINSEYKIHDFRIVRGPSHTNLVFDVLIPSEDHINHDELIQQISSMVKKDIGNNYYCVINIDHSFV